MCCFFAVKEEEPADEFFDCVSDEEPEPAECADGKDNIDVHSKYTMSSSHCPISLSNRTGTYCFPHL